MSVAESRHSMLEVSTSRLIHNLDYFQSLLKPKTKLMVMVKAMAYGLGDLEISRILEENGVDYIGVAYAAEGVYLRKNGISLPILVLNPGPHDFEALFQNNLELEIFSINILKELKQYCEINDKHFKVHLKFDTGMHRLGLIESDIHEILNIITGLNQLSVIGISSHLAAAEDSGQDVFTKDQLEKHLKCFNNVSGKLKSKPLSHVLNTAGILIYPEYQFDMVRLGIGLYGVDPVGDFSKNIYPVCSLKSKISQIKNLNRGETVSYGRRGIIEKDHTPIGTLGIGYADGVFRSLGNGKGKVWINGQFAPTIGDVCMDMLMVDLSGITAKEGDYAELWGYNQSVEDVARAANTISYEIFTAVGNRVERIYID